MNAPFPAGGSSGTMNLTACCENMFFKTMPKKQPDGKMNMASALKSSEGNALMKGMPKKGASKKNMTLPTGGANKLVG